MYATKAAAVNLELGPAEPFEFGSVEFWKVFWQCTLCYYMAMRGLFVEVA